MSAHELFLAMRKRYAEEKGWIVLDEVSNSTGVNRTRSCDALALGTWPSQGYALHGFELKVTRKDLEKELCQHDKAEAVKKYCNRWWLVVTDEEVYSGSEVPEEWGILVLRHGVLRAEREAPKLEPKPWTPGFLCSVARTAFRRSSAQRALEEATKKAYDEGFRRCEVLGNSNATRALQSKEQAERVIRAFEEASGQSLGLHTYGEWVARSLGEKVKTTIGLGLGESVLNAQSFAKSLDEAATRLREAVKVATESATEQKVST